MSTWLVLLLTLFVIVLVAGIQARYNLLQYLFFLRVPLLTAIAMAVLPFFAGDDDPPIIQNWFELDFFGLAIVTWLALILSWTIMHTVGVLFTNVPGRLHLALVKPTGDESATSRDARNKLPGWFTTWKRYPVFAIFALPIVYACWQRTDALEWSDKAMAVGAGMAFGALMVLASERLRKWKLDRDRVRREKLGAATVELEPAPEASLPSPGPSKPATDAPSEPGDGWSDIGPKIDRYLHLSATLAEIRDAHSEHRDRVYTLRSAWAFMIYAVALYALGIVLSPGWSLPIADYVPAIAYVMILLMLIVSVLSGLSLFFDKYRLPLLVVLITGVWLSYATTKVDHYYDISMSAQAANTSASPACADPVARTGVAGSDHGEETASRETQCDVLGPEQALRLRLGARPEGTPIVVVAASGGGITAAYWSVVVLEELHRRFGATFAESIVLVSAVSGGAVGTMYYVDRYTETSVPNDSQVSAALELAGRSSLSAIGWGAVYPDFWRLFFSPFVPEAVDRGWALERRWAAHNSLEGRRLGDWRLGVEAGWRPTMIFNATISETGHRLLIAPINLDGVASNEDRRAQTLIGAGDAIEVVTAARLSATFPYVSPIARSDRFDQVTTVHDYHVGDGGYFDNFGVMSAVDFLVETMSVLEEVERPIIIVEIRASDEGSLAEPREGTSVVDALIGPLDTLLNVRTPLQLARNKVEVTRLAADLALRQVPLYHVTFVLGGKNPISWHLSQSDKQRIRGATGSKHNQAQFTVLEYLFAP